MPAVSPSSAYWPPLLAETNCTPGGRVSVIVKIGYSVEFVVVHTDTTHATFRFIRVLVAPTLPMAHCGAAPAMSVKAVVDGSTELSSGSVTVAVFDTVCCNTGTVPTGTRTLMKIAPELPGAHVPAVPTTRGLAGSALSSEKLVGHTEAGPVALTNSNGARLPKMSRNFGIGSENSDPSQPSIGGVGSAFEHV